MAVNPISSSAAPLSGHGAAQPERLWRRRLAAATWRLVPSRELLSALAPGWTRCDTLQTIAYVLLSAGAALAGSVAAIGLVPLMHPGHPSASGGLPFVLDGAERQAAVFAMAMAAFALMRWQAARLGACLVSRCGTSLRRKVHARLIDAPLHALADASSAEIANVLTYNAEMLVQGFGALLQLAVVALTTVVSLTFAFWISPALMLVTPFVLALGLLAARAYGRELSVVSRTYVADMTQLFWFSEDFPRRLRHVRSFERQAAEKAGYGSISVRLGLGYQRQLELAAGGRLLLELLAAAGIAGMFLLADRWHGMDGATPIAVGLLLGRLLPYLVSTRQHFQQLRSAVPAMELWQRYMALGQNDLKEAPPRAMISGEVLHLECVRLRVPSLEVRDLVLVPGELTLVSGDSGIGKSSLVDVLAGMARPAAFIARLGTQSIGFDSYRTLVRNGAYVSQGVRPWQHTVRECLLWACPHASEDAMHSVLADVGLASRIALSDKGLEMPLHEASCRLSGGELQRLLLAQVILRQPALAILDEATSALDAASELAVLSVLRRRLPRTVLLLVSHRPAVMALANRSLIIGGPSTEIPESDRTVHYG